MKQLLQGIAIGVAFFGTFGIAQAIIIVDHCCLIVISTEKVVEKR